MAKDVIDSATASALCEADRTKQYKTGPDQDEDLLLITISLGQDIDLDAMAKMSSQGACKATGGQTQRYCPAPNDPNCCHYRAPTPQTIEAVFREILNSGPVRLVE